MAYRQLTRYKGVYQRIIKPKGNDDKADICFDISYRHEGKLVWEKIGTVTEGYSPKIAANIRVERVRAIRHGDDLPKQKKPAPYFKDIAKKYLTWAVANKARAGRSDKSLYENHLSIFDNKRLNELSPFDIEKLKITLLKKGLSPATVKHCLILVRQMVNKAIIWMDYKSPNPVKGVKMPVLQNQRQRFLTYMEANTLLEELSKVSKQVHDMALISLQCGLRASEIFKLKGQHLDFENELITISDPKNKTTRRAFMTNQIREVLTKIIPDGPDDLVFKKKRRYHVRENPPHDRSARKSGDGEEIMEISKTFSRAVVALGLNDGIQDPRQKVTFHTLRHTFASWLALQGVQIQTIQELLGHKTLAMTIQYSHLVPDMKRTATLELEQIFNEKKKQQGSKVIKIQE